MESMLALVKDHRGPGLTLESVPVPRAGPGEVLIRVLKTGICGTDLHIYEWDDWAQRTIPVPLVVGHEFVGEIVELGDGRAGSRARRPGQRRGPHRLRPLPQLPGRAPPPLRAHRGHRRRPPRRLRRVRRAPGDQRLAARCRADPARRRSPSSTRSATPCTRRSPSRARRGRADHRRRARSACMAAAVVRHAGARHVVITDVNPTRLELAGKMGVVARRRRAQLPARRGDGRPRHDGGLRRRPGDVRQPGRAAADDRVDGARRAHRAARASGGRDPDRLGARDLQRAHDQGHLRPRDVRDLVQDDGDGPERARHLAGDHPPLRRRRLRGGLRDSCAPATAARSSSTGRPRSTARAANHASLEERRDHRCRQRSASDGAAGRRASRACSRSSAPIAGAQGRMGAARRRARACSTCAPTTTSASPTHPRVVAAARRGARPTGATAWPSVRFICGTQDAPQAARGSHRALPRHGGHDPLLLLLRRQRRPLRDAARRGGRRDQRRAQPRRRSSTAIRLCKAQRLRYRNRDMADLEAQLKEAARRARPPDRDRRRVLDGRQHRAARATSATSPSATTPSSWSTTRTRVGFVGRAGRGTPEHYGVAGRVDILTGTLGKALGGASGGYTSGRERSSSCSASARGPTCSPTAWRR